MEINSFNVGRLKLGNLFDFIKKVKLLVEKEGAEKLKISSQYNNLLVPAFEKFDLAYQKGRKSEHTPKIAGIDKIRDDTTVAIVGIINVMLKSDDPEVVKSAKAMKFLIDDGFKGITKLSRSEQSSKTTNLLQAIKSKCVADATKLGLDDWLEKLEKLNNEIIASQMVRVDEKVEKKKLDTTQAKKDVIAAYRMTCSQVETSVAAEGIANYRDFILGLNVLIEEFVGVSSSHKDRNNDKKPTEPETPTEPEKYPDAKEWTNMVDSGDFKLGDICFMVVDGVKKYYKMIDESNFNVRPNGGEGELGWEPVV